MNIILFEDAAANALAPVSLTRPAWAIRCASLRLIDWIESMASSVTSYVRPHLQELQLNDWPKFDQTPKPSDSIGLVVNARLAPTVSNLDSLKTFAAKHHEASNKIIIVRSGSLRTRQRRDRLQAL